MITQQNGFGREDCFCDKCKSYLFSVEFDDNGDIFIMCPSCFEHLNIGITTEAHKLLMEEAKK